jgi:hypothetical protein
VTAKVVSSGGNLAGEYRGDARRAVAQMTIGDLVICGFTRPDAWKTNGPPNA